MMSLPRLALIVLLSVSLASCGGRQKLKPVDGAKPIPTAIGASAPATPEQLMDKSPQAQPDRSAEPLKRSVERQEDPFDLPPAS